MPDATQRKPEINEFMPEDYFARIDPSKIFDNHQPLELDLGTGDGTFLIDMAKHHPDRNFLGVERLLGRVKKICKKARQAELSNCKALRLESKYVVEWLLPDNCIDRLHILCPDPWPKERHHKRRLIQQPFLAEVLRVLKPGGHFCFKTDHPEYFEWILQELKTFQKLKQLPWPENAFFYPKTDFQRQWEAEGKKIHKVLTQK